MGQNLMFAVYMRRLIVSATTKTTRNFFIPLSILSNIHYLKIVLPTCLYHIGKMEKILPQQLRKNSNNPDQIANHGNFHVKETVIIVRILLFTVKKQLIFPVINHF